MATAQSMAMRVEAAAARIEAARQELKAILPMPGLDAPILVPARDPEMARVLTLESFAAWAETLVRAIPALLGVDVPSAPEVEGLDEVAPYPPALAETPPAKKGKTGKR